ncbi:MAG: ATP-binding cassette domain-containing protein [Deltaproteobacteria bacterium]|jgi:ATP-binding cassette subfamily F protein 3|nr:ATP-binding cassette domain-containing protein [Deltaproteobacteria bacterium]
MLTVTNLDIRYGEKHLFNDVSARINDRDHIGLVGVNGAGKSTLLKIISGITETDPGVVRRPKRFSVAYLPQEATALDTGRTIYHEAESAFAGVLALQEELDEVNRQLAITGPSDKGFEKLLKKQAELQHRLERVDIFRVRAETEKVLMGLGFGVEDFDRPSSSLSGGWLMRLMLARLLLARPDLLLLDEPTNHLDLDSLTWLENFLLTYNGGLVIISHDRTFLDRVTSITWELSLGRLTAFRGNYSKYVADKDIRLQVERAAYANQQAQIRQTMRFVQRFRAKSTKAKQVQSRLRQLSRMERIELAEAEQEVAFHFPPAAPSGRHVLDVQSLGKTYDGKQVFSGVSFQLQRGDKIAVVGVNGAGKSTLMKILAGLVTPEAGKIKPGHNVRISYFGQHQAQELPEGLTALQTLAAVAGDMTMTQIRSLLGAFLFRGEEVEKKVDVLSGGEKSRLALAKMIVQPANLLILDEPTNHLDMSSQEVLQEALAQYDGTIIIVSHNRHFVNRFINKVLEIKNGTASLYEGNIEDYLYTLGKLAERAPAAPEEPSAEAKNGEEVPAKLRGKAARQEQAKARQEKSRRLMPLKKEAEQAEETIEKLEARKRELEQLMADPKFYQDQEKFAESSREYSAVERRLGRLFEQWEEVQARIEELE